MDGLQLTDPFLWDVEAVAAELCRLSRPCTRSPDNLFAKLQENEIDGHTLLTYDLVGLANAHDLRNELFQILNVQLARHKNALGEAIMKLRARSPGFRQWRLENLDVGVIDERDARSARTREGTYSTQMTPRSELVLPAAMSRNAGSDIAPPTSPQPQSMHLGTALSMPEPDTPGTDIERIQDAHTDPVTPPTEPSPLPVSKSPTLETSPPARQLKRKRVAPQLIQDKPVNPIPIPIASDADMLSHTLLDTASIVQGQASAYPWDSSDGLTYLGPGSIPSSDVKSSMISLTAQIHGEGDALRTPAPTRLPPGRRLVVDKIMRRVLVKNGRKIALVDSGVHFDEIRQSSSEGDNILDLDELPEDLDEETLREVEAEQREEIKASMGSKSVAPNRVQELLDEEVSAMMAAWREKKLPKYQNRAYKLWADASKCGTKKSIIEARANAKFYDERIKKLKREILGQLWEKEKDVRFQARCLEQTVQDKLYQCWLADILESRFPPPKPKTLPRRSIMGLQVKEEELSEGEILTSSDEESFIIEDDEPVKSAPHIKNSQNFLPTALNRTPSPVRGESPICIDLTQTASTRASSPVKGSTKTFRGVDLDTPTKLRHKSSETTQAEATRAEPQPQPQPLPWAEKYRDKYRDIQKIVSFPPGHWCKEKDRFALVITLLWRLKHIRRSNIFHHVQRCDVQQAFESTILRHISKPLIDPNSPDSPSEEVLAFDICRLFLCFLKLKNLKETRIADLKSAQVEKLKSKQSVSSWNIFHAFILQIAPLFPQDKQIYREEAFDDELLGDDAADADVSLLSEGVKAPRKVPAKEIVRDKDAVDLREREIRRQEEQEARKRRLRARLGNNGSISSDKSRLIVNESKQDDQPFIYINEEIGSRIKDHQIDGVRFMWNQIVQDLEVRQGCLLAHSMGLGKTMQVITLLVAMQESSKSSEPDIVSQIPEDLRQSKTLVTCPAGLVNNWMDELLTWDKDSVLGELHVIEAGRLHGEHLSITQKWRQNGGILVIGYPMLQKLFNSDDVQRQAFFDEPNIVVADEAHMLKNPNSKVHIACDRFKTSSRIAMTGSPLANNIDEYYFMINWVAPNFLGPLPEFREIYSNPISHGVELGSSSYAKRKALKKLEALKLIVAPKVHRATIKTCMNKDLPPKQEFVICVKPKALQTKLYNLCVQAIRGESVGQTETVPQGAIFRVTSHLGVLCNHPYGFYQKARDSLNPPKENTQARARLPESIIPAVLAEFANNHEPESPSLSTKVELLIQILDHARALKDKVLVFSQSIPTIDYLEKLFKIQNRRFSRLDGKTPVPKRQEQVKNFNENKTELYLISTRAGGVGLNIQGANRVVILDFGWNPVHEQQAIGRSFRIGQTKPVSVYHFVTAGTFEQDLHGKTVFKTQLATRVVDKKNPISWGNREADLKHDIKEVRRENLTKLEGKDAILDKLIAFSNDQDAIRKIMSTDTFEEEDTKAPLSAEEQKEANDMAALNSLRLTNPGEYRRKQRELEEKEMLQLSSHTPHPSYPPSFSAGNGMTVPDIARTMDGASDGPLSSMPRAETQTQPAAPTITAATVTTTPAASGIPTAALQLAGKATGVRVQAHRMVFTTNI